MPKTTKVKLTDFDKRFLQEEVELMQVKMNQLNTNIKHTKEAIRSSYLEV